MTTKASLSPDQGWPPIQLSPRRTGLNFAKQRVTGVSLRCKPYLRPAASCQQNRSVVKCFGPFSTVPLEKRKNCFPFTTSTTQPLQPLVVTNSYEISGRVQDLTGIFQTSSFVNFITNSFTAMISTIIHLKISQLKYTYFMYCS